MASSVGSADQPKKDQCDGANCGVVQSSDDPWARETRCSRTPGENWPEFQVRAAIFEEDVSS